MKATHIFSLMALTILIASCGSQKQVTTTTPPAPSTEGREEIEIPCQMYDDANYFRAAGTAININKQNARSAALNAAKSMINQKLGGMVRGVTIDYQKIQSGNARQEDIARLIESELQMAVERSLNDAEQICEKLYQTAAGNYESWIGIQISKKKIVTEIERSLSENEKTKVVFDREKFEKANQKYFE